jgi:thiol-disulfide isomerase/thioredoxin
MDELEKIFENNKDSFDRLRPDDEIWAKIEGGNPPKKRIKHLVVIGVAATIAIVLGVTSILNFNAQGRIPNEDHEHFENLSMTSPSGEKIILDPTKNKVTLIQFWATGNVVCDEDNCYYYLPAYEKYRDQGFEIYAVSLDEDKSEWIKNIEENNLPWIHGTELKGLESLVCVECNITKLANSYLLDENGKIIMKNLDSKSLDEALSKLLAQN